MPDLVLARRTRYACNGTPAPVDAALNVARTAYGARWGHVHFVRTVRFQAHLVHNCESELPDMPPTDASERVAGQELCDCLSCGFDGVDRFASDV
eukprot:2978240-Prymnesium_polylepis.2